MALFNKINKKETTEEIKDLLIYLRNKDTTNTKILELKKEVFEYYHNKKMIKRINKAIESVKNGKKMWEILYYDLKYITEAEKETLKTFSNFEKGLKLIYDRRIQNQKLSITYIKDLFIIPLAIVFTYYFAFDKVVKYNQSMINIGLSVSKNFNLGQPFPFQDKMYPLILIIIFHLKHI